MTKHNTYWHYDVMKDLAEALRQEGLLQTAELLDDAGHVLVEEIAAQPMSLEGELPIQHTGKFPHKLTTRQ